VQVSGSVEQSDAAAALDAKAVLITAFGACIGHQFGTAATASTVAEYDTFLLAPGANALLNLPILSAFFTKIVDISGNRADPDDQEEEQQIDIDG